MELLVVLVVVAIVWMVVSSSRRLNAAPPRPQLSAADLDAARRAAEEDVTRFGEELQRLDLDVKMAAVDEGMLQDWQRALDSYEAAKRSLELVQRPEDVRHVTSALEDGRYAVACVRARREGRPLPQRRPPCFFNPSHGPSTTDVDWAPPGGQARRIPVCGADADRVAQGAEPDVRTVPMGPGRVPYWQAGPAYSPWAMGYFSSYAMSGLLPGFLLGSLLSTSWDGGMVDGFGYDGGYAGDDDGGYDGGYDGGDSGYDGGDDIDASGGGGGFGDGGFGDFGDFGDFGL
jgi:hypothetical protein